MDKKEIDKCIRNILIPVIIEQALLTLSNIIITSYIGRLNVTDISSFGIGNKIFNIYYALFRGISLGMVVLQAKNYGDGNRQKSYNLQKLCYITIMPFAIILAIIIFLLKEPIILFMTKDSILINTASRYLSIVIICFPFMSMASINASIFQGQGNTKIPMLIAAFSNCINIILGYFLIIGIGSFASLGINGAAITKVVSSIAMCILGLYLIYGKNGLLYGVKKSCIKEIFIINDIRNILRLGIPAALEYSFWNLSSVYICKVILLYGTDFYAAYELGLQAEELVEMMSVGFVTASTSLSSRAIGKKDNVLYKNYYKRLYRIALYISIITTLFLTIFSRRFLALLTNKELLINIAFGYLLIQSLAQIPTNFSKIEFGYIRSCNHEKIPMILRFIGIWLVRIPLVVLFGKYLHTDIIFIWLAFAADLWISYLVAWIYSKNKKIINYLDVNGEQHGIHYRE